MTSVKLSVDDMRDVLWRELRDADDEDSEVKTALFYAWDEIGLLRYDAL
jgi:hypothetical protein